MCCADFFFLSKHFASQIIECEAFSLVYAGLHEIEGEREREKCDYILVRCFCVTVFSVFMHFCCLCVRVRVHASVFHLTIHSGPGSICLSDHLM